MYACIKMKSLSGVGLGLSLVFGCLLLALMAEIYYLLWWKNKTIHKTPHSQSHPNNIINENSHGTQIQIRGQISQILTTCCKKPMSSLTTPTPHRHHLCSSPTTTLVHDPQSSHPNKHLSKNPIEALPRFLFTITEETLEDLEQSEDGFVVRRSKQSTHLGDLLQVLETPFLTPIGSPAYYTPPLTPTVWISSSGISHENDCQRISGQFFEAERERVRDAAFNRMRASPPPKFKFLRDAEEKMIQRRRLMEQQGQDSELNNGF